MIYSHDSDVSDVVNNDLTRFDRWAKTWLNPTKAKHMTITRATPVTDMTVTMNGTDIDTVTEHKHLGVVLNSNGTWNDHIDYIIGKASKRLGVLRSLKYKLDRDSLRTIYITHIRSLIDYCDIVWSNCSQELSEKLNKVQYEAARIITGLPRFCRINSLLSESSLISLESRRTDHKLISFYKILRGQTPDYLTSLMPQTRLETTTRFLRSMDNITSATGRLSTYSNSFSPTSINLWNSLPRTIRSLPTISSFKTHILSSHYLIYLKITTELQSYILASYIPVVH